MIKSYKSKRMVADICIYIFLGVCGILWILPFLWLVMTSFSGESAAYIDTVIPASWSFKNYTELFTDTKLINYGQFFLNTLFVACFSCAISTISVLMVSYTFSRLRFKSRKKFVNIGMILGMFPGFLTMVAIYYLLKAMGLTKSLLALIIVYSAGAALGYFVAKGFFDTIPRALDEAATIDGANKNQIFWKIILPMSKPIIVYTVLTSFLGPWADFIFAKIIMGDNRESYTIALGLWTMLDKENFNDYFYRFCSGSVLISIPITALFLKMQKYYVEGVTGGAVKG